MYRLIALDIDDTLLNDAGELTEGNLAALTEAMGKGVKIIFCSGRPYKGLLPFIEKLKINQKGNYAVCLNGAQMYDLYEDKMMWEQTFDKEYFFAIYELAKQYDVDVQVHIGKELIVEKDSAQIANYIKRLPITPIWVDSLVHYIDKDIAKALVIGDTSILKEIEQKCKCTLQSALNMYLSRPRFLEFVSIKTNKGVAMLAVAEILGIEKEEVMAVGDSYNDIQMLQAAGFGVCMQNGAALAKEVADYITKNNNNNDGVKEVIEKFVLR